ncbi:hypothetical protein BGW39_009265 [Mortierella sp. 14UC]|nr:hypothetical protein BGW39_009265 [Mortierella sp. 14UC]
MSFNTEHRDSQHETLYMFVDQSQMMFKDTDLLMDEHPSEYPAIKTEPYDSNLVSYDSTQQRLAITTLTRQQQHPQPQLHDGGTRMIPEGDHRFGMSVMDMMSSSSPSFDPSQSSDSGLSSVAQLKDAVDYSKTYLSTHMTPSEPTSSSDGASAPWTTASNQSQNGFNTDGACSQDSEDGSQPQQQQQQMTTAEFWSASPLHQRGSNNYGGSGGSGGSPLTGISISQIPGTPFTTSGSSPALSTTTTLAVASSSSPLSSSSPMAEIVESPEEIALRRAEQNRAAQRAFRQRKQKYIKWLESKAEELDEVYRILALVRTENQQLCNLVMELDEKLSHSGSGGGAAVAARDLKRLSSPAILTIGSSTSTDATAVTTAAAAVMSSIESRMGDGPDTVHAKSGTTTTIRGVDGSIGREISMRLMNLATFPGLGSTADQDAAMLRKLKYHPRSSNIGKSSSSSSGSGSTGGNSGSNSKGKMNLKVDQHSKRPGTILHNAAALQPSTLLRQQQLQHREQSEHQQKKQKQHQQQRQQQHQPPAHVVDCSTTTIPPTTATGP